jgi:hypothetical protein
MAAMSNACCTIWRSESGPTLPPRREVRMKRPIARLMLGLALVGVCASASHAQAPRGNPDPGTTLKMIFGGRASELPPPPAGGQLAAPGPSGGDAAASARGGAAPGGADFGAIFNKIFRPTPPPRRPDREAAPSDANPVAAAPSPSASARPQAGGLALSGVIIAGNTKMALLQRPDSPSGPELVKLGDALGPYRLTAVEPDRVTLSGPDGDVLLRLSAGSSTSDAPPGGGADRAAAAGATAGAALGGTPDQRAAASGPAEVHTKRRPDRRSQQAPAPEAVTVEGQAQDAGKPEAAQVDKPRRGEKRNRGARAERNTGKAQVGAGQPSR